jgi:nucleotide-binding universal stress UspA family protein
MYESILVPLEGSRRAEAVLPFVVDLAKQYKSDVVLFRVAPAFYQVWRETVPGAVDIAPSGAVLGMEIAQEAARNRIRNAKRYLSRVRGRLHHVGLPDVDVVIAQGDPAAEIVRYAREEEVDLIAIATHGRSGLARA